VPNPNETESNGNKNMRGALFFLAAFLLIAGLMLYSNNRKAQSEELSYPKLIELIKNGKIKSEEAMPLELVVTEGSNTQELHGFYNKEITIDPKNPQEVISQFRTRIFVPYNGEELQNVLKESKLTPTIKMDSNPLGTFLIHFLPLILFLVILYFIFSSQSKMAGKGGPFGFGKSKAKKLTKENNKITFKDVAGVDEAKEEVSELVEFLKDPKRFQKIGGRIPKGVLMCGPPGTGKTLLARAIATEADVPFFSISGSDFVEMFVGVGASRVRDMFEEGKKSAPCLIFIDEIDAVGRHRGSGVGGGHDEREQTLNALLVEMDGFDAQSGIIIIAATNRPDVLDPALLRPGRFDRQVTVGLPDVKGREEILKVHTKKTKISEEVDLGVIAKGTPGYSGAELENLVNEAALLTARRGQNAIGMKELEEARDKVRWGKERRSLSLSEKEKKTTAYHEAGHALLLVMLEHTEPLHKVTIIPRGPSLGSTMWLPQTDKYNTRRKELLDHLVVIMGGRVAEEVAFGDVTSGASGDIKQASDIARKMVCRWGMSEKIGMIEYGGDGEHMFLARDLQRARDFSEQTAQEIDREVKRIIDDSYNRAKELLIANKDLLDLISTALLEFETLDGKEIEEILKTKSIETIRTKNDEKSKRERKLDIKS
jgi:cell division protease FtsH